MDSEYLENYVWIYAHANGLDQGIVLWVKYLIPLQFWKLNTLFGDSLVNYKKLSSKTLRLAALQRLGSNFFHSITVDKKNFFFGKSYV